MAYVVYLLPLWPTFENVSNFVFSYYKTKYTGKLPSSKIQPKSHRHSVYLLLMGSDI